MPPAAMQPLFERYSSEAIGIKPCEFFMTTDGAFVVPQCSVFFEKSSAQCETELAKARQNFPFRMSASRSEKRCRLEARTMPSNGGTSARP
jgi:hypothetical protein